MATKINNSKEMLFLQTTFDEFSIYLTVGVGYSPSIFLTEGNANCIESSTKFLV